MAYRASTSSSIANLHSLLGGLALIGCAIIAFSSPSSAQDLYAIADIAIDETAESEVEAKEIGIAKAKIEAFESLLSRIAETEIVDQTQSLSSNEESAATDPAGDDEVPQGPAQVVLPDPERLESFIRDVSITDERFGGGRYLANISVRFQAEAVNRYLQRAKAAYLAAPSPKAVILPLFQDASGTETLWDEGNPWLDAWLRTDGRRAVVPFTVPLGDLSDIAAIDAARLNAVDARAINAIAARHRAGAVIVPRAELDAQGNVIVSLITYGTGWPQEPERFTLSQAALVVDAEELYADLSAINPEGIGPKLHAAALQVASRLDARWKSENMLRFDQEATTLQVVAPLAGLADWLSVQSSLNSVSAVTGWKLAELNATYARVSIDYVGDEERLGQAFALQNLLLSVDPEAKENDPEAPRLLVRR